MIVQVGNNAIQFPDDMPHEEIVAIIQQHFPETPRPNHDSLEEAAVTGADSLDMQELDDTVKPVVKMTIPELMELAPRIGDKLVFIKAGEVYVISPTVSVTDAIEGIMSGNDSEVLGYPGKGDSDCCVTKDGEIVTDLAEMKEHAANKNVAWAANGDAEELQGKAEKVAQAIYKQRSQL